MAVYVVADMYSGRPNPGWSLTDSDDVSFRERLDVLAETMEGPQREAPLGYRGLQIRLGDETIHIWRGLVRRGERIFHDPERNLERWLVARAGNSLEPHARAAIDLTTNEG